MVHAMRFAASLWLPDVTDLFTQLTCSPRSDLR